MTSLLATSSSGDDGDDKFQEEIDSKRQLSTMDSSSSSSRSANFRGNRPYSHSDLGFVAWDSCSLTVDAGACLGLDFGGTLSKIVFFQPADCPQYANPLCDFFLNSTSYGSSGRRDSELSFFSEKLGGRLHFIHFETSHTMGAIRMLKNFQHNVKRVHATGGGAFKYAQMVKDELGIKLMKRDELQTVVRGIIFTLLEHPDSECFTLEPGEVNNEKENGKRTLDNVGISHVDALSYEMQKVPIPMPVASDSFFPLLVVNIGSGVSIINVTGPTTFKRVSGTAIGGATYYGLCKLLLRCKTFDEAMDLAQLGDSRNVNLTVQDIYGGSYNNVGLSGEITASFFGKCAITAGSVRTARSRKRGFVSMLERLILVLIALLAAMLLKDNYLFTFIEEDQFISGNRVLREVLILLMPGVVVYFVFLSSEAKLSSSFPPLQPFAASDQNTVKQQKPSVRKSTSFEEADIARALVIMVAQNVTQIAFLNAKLYKSQRVLFTGNFLRHNQIALRALCSMMYIWSQGEIQALFMEHEGYFGAVGTFLYSCGIGNVVAETFADEDSCGEHHHHTEKPATAPTSLHSDGAHVFKNDTLNRDTTSSDTSSSSDEDKNIVADLLFKGEFPRRRLKTFINAFSISQRQSGEVERLGHKR